MRSMEEIVEIMAENAHNAWWQAYIQLGYKSRRAEWGEEFMVPFDQLTELGKEFDRIIMRGILRGFALHNLVIADGPVADTEQEMGGRIVALITAGLDGFEGLVPMLINELSETETKQTLAAMSHWAAFLTTQMYEDPFLWAREVGKFVKSLPSDLPPESPDDKV